MTNYAVQEQNQDLVSLLAAHFRLLYNPTHAMADAVSMLQAFSGLRGLWTLGQYNASGEAVDISGNGLHLARSNVLLREPVAGLEPNSLWNVTNRYLSHADSADFDLVGDEAYVGSGFDLRGMTLGMWVLFSSGSIGAHANLISKWGAAGQRSYGLYKDATDVLVFRVSGDGTAQPLVISTATATSFTSYYFICARYTSEATELAVWVNGEKATDTTSVPSTLFNSTTDFRIGQSVSSLGGSTDSFLGRGSLAFLCHAAVPDSIINAYYQMTAPLFGISV